MDNITKDGTTLVDSSKQGNDLSAKKKILKPQKQLSPYQQFLNKNPSYERYKQNYFNFYDDVKDSTHRIYDW